MELISIIYILIASVSLFFSFRILLGRQVHRLPLPPGPSLIPTSIPERDIWRTFQKWHSKSGPLISFKIGSRTVIILGDHRMAHDLLEKRGNIYSSRPKSIFMDNYLLKGLQPGFMPYGTVWRLHRRLHTSLLGTQASQAYRVIQDLESKQLAYEILSTRDFSKTFHRFTASTMFTLAYGRELSYDDHDMQEIKDINEMVEFALQGISVGSFLVDVFPILDRLPKFLARWKSSAERVHQNTKLALTRCYNIGIQEGNWNWSKESLKREELKELSHEQLAFSVGELYIGGSHTSQIMLETFVLASLLYPRTVRKVQQELDSAVGTHRLPLFEDIGKLPYVNAFINELLRWRQVLPLGVPHASAEDDEYMGYSIPANSIVIANQWQMNMDENIFEDPESFQPERWIRKPDLPLSVFGFGRRVCPGQRLARSTLSIAISRLLWAYDIFCLDEDHREQAQAANMSGLLGSVYKPSRFNAYFEIRSPKHKEIIEREWALSDKDRKQMLGDIENSLFSPKP